MNRIWWQRLGLVVGALVVAVGGGIGGMAAWQAQPPAVPTGSNLPPDPPPRLVGAPLTPSERYQALLTKYNAALKAYQAAVAQAETDAARTEAYKLSPNPADHSPGFVALAEEFPADPVAVDALLWVAQQGLSSVNPPADPGAKAFAQALLILARDHADEPRVGAYCPELTRFVDPIKDDFLRTVAARSRDRVVRGRATLALASYLRQKAALAEMFQHPDQPVRFDDLIPSGLPADQRPPLPADLVAYRGQVEAMYTKFHPAFVGTLKQADVAALRAEADRDYERVLTEFATVPAVAYDPKQTPESLADLVRRERQPRPPAKPVVPPPVDPGAERFAALVRRYDAAIARASAAGEAAGPGVPAVRAYMAAQPRWSDFGPELIALSNAAPPSDSARSALLWTVARQGTFADAAEGRATQLGAAVDGLIRDHLAWIGTHLDDPAVQAATNFGESFPAPHVDRLYAALTEHGPSPEARGRSSLLHARHRQAEADLVASFEARGADPARRPEIALFASSYLDHLRAIGAGPLAADAVTRFEQLRRDYGTLSAGPTGETLATVADRALFDLHHLALGAVAPPIHGTDIAGQPMQLADFRGRVVVLDFGSHDRCGACRLLYPRQRELVAKYPSDRFALLGVQSHDPIATLRDLAARREITWRCWSDSTTPDQAGPITTQWNIHRFPTFILLDANGVIRSKDLHPLDPEFERNIDRLIAESAQP